MGTCVACDQSTVPEGTSTSCTLTRTCSPVTTAYRDGTLQVTPVKPKTIAKSLAIGNPADGYYSLRIIQETGGFAEAVDDAEIVEGIKLLARTEGIFAETAGGVTVGVLKKLVAAKKLDPDETIVAYITGNGLKTQEAVADAVRPPIHIRPTMRDFEASGAAGLHLVHSVA